MNSESGKLPHLPFPIAPDKGEGIEVTPPKTVAGGVPAVVASMKHAYAEMGAERSVQMLRLVNQKEGFDCPGCAWPDPNGHRSPTEFCENGAKAVAEEATTKHVPPEFFAQWSLSQLSEQSDMWLGKQGRLTHPMVLRAGREHYEPIEWDEAFELIANELNALNSPNEAIFYTSGRTSNEAAFLYQLFVRMYGTNNLPDCSNMCHESSGWGLGEAIGTGKSTVTLEDVEAADAIFVIGQNPGTNHPRMLSALQIAARNGSKIVSINPLPETGLSRFIHPQEPLSLLGPGTPLACLHLPVRVNGDVALIKGIMKAMLEVEDTQPGTVLDHQFIAEYTDGFEAFAADLRQTPWEEIIEHSGISREEIGSAAEIAGNSERTMICWAMGLTQHKNGVANIQELVNLALLRGNIGRPGAGLCCVRGHSNVQGDRTMGIWEQMSDSFLDKLGAEFNFEPPRSHGFDTVQAIEAMHAGKATVFFGLGGNFLAATPDTAYTADALRGCSMTVQVSTKLNRGHLITGRQALILPCLGRTEQDIQAEGAQFVSVEDTMSVIHSSHGTLHPGSEFLRSEVAIVAGLALATVGGPTDWKALSGNYDRIRDHVSHVVPGFEDYNTRVRHPGGFPLPNSARERKFPTATGKARFSVHPIPHHDLPQGHYLLTSIRSHDQFNTTIYGLDDRYRGIHNGRRVIFLNAVDIAEAGLAAGQVVDLTSHFEGEERVAYHFVIVPYAIPRRCAAAYYPETNVLVPIRSVADISNTPTSKSVVISLSVSDV